MPSLISCPHCASVLNNDGLIVGDVACPFCGQQFTIPSPPVAFQSQLQPSPAVYIPDKKSAGVAAVLSFFYIGVGQIYNGEIVKGLLLMLVIPSGVAISFLFGSKIAQVTNDPVAFKVIAATAAILFLVLWIWNIFDAYTTAERINHQHRRRYGGA
jgi:TM2 domain-containing membrane protein YozV